MFIVFWLQTKYKKYTYAGKIKKKHTNNLFEYLNSAEINSEQKTFTTDFISISKPNNPHNVY